MYAVLPTVSTCLLVTIYKTHECHDIGNWKEKHPERGDWDINGGGGMIDVLLFSGIDFF